MISLMSEQYIRTEEQEARLRELADRLPVREATEADQEWIEKARLEVARRAILAASEQNEQ